MGRVWAVDQVVPECEEVGWLMVTESLMTRDRESAQNLYWAYLYDLNCSERTREALIVENLYNQFCNVVDTRLKLDLSLSACTRIRGQLESKVCKF